MNRRKFLTLVGGGTILAAGAAFGGFAATRNPTKALQPWKDAGSAYTEPRRKALSYAILAPNPHNRQPWKIDLSQADTIEILVDTDRMLPATDPFNRQITIGLGCFLEVLRIAAAQDGFAINEQLFPQGTNDEKLDKRPVAILKFTKQTDVKKDPLFAHILNRRSLRVPFDTAKPVSPNSLSNLSKTTSGLVSIATSNDDKKVKLLRDLTAKASHKELTTPRTFKESVDLFRIGKAEIEANPDGLSFSGAMFESLAMVGAFTREAALDPTSTGFQQALSAELELSNTAMGFVWLVTKTNTRIDQIAAGRQWVRVNLSSTGMGLGVHPLSQALQEYPEMSDLYKTAHNILAPNGGTVQMLGRLGYGDAVDPKPRWGLTKKIL